MKCGGLLEVDKRTMTFGNLFEARLKVKGLRNGFLPTTIDVQLDGSSAVVRLNALTKSSGRREIHRQWWCRPDLGDFSIGEGGGEGSQATAKTHGRKEVRSQTGDLNEVEGGNGGRGRDERGQRPPSILEDLRACASNPMEVSGLGLGGQDKSIHLVSRYEARILQKG
ncbi:hypothetical protein CsSME_00021858 [Camellia sinensis var. sinensis]